MGRPDPDTRKTLLERFVRDCEVVELVAKGSGSKANIKEQGRRAKGAVTAPQADDATSQIKRKRNDKEEEVQNAKAASPEADESMQGLSSKAAPEADESEQGSSSKASPEADESPVQGSSSNINKGQPVEANPAPEPSITTRDTSEVIAHQTDQQPFARGDSPLTSQSETQSPRTTRAHKVSEVNRTDKINQSTRGTRKSTHVTSQTHDKVRSLSFSSSYYDILTCF
ncbi:uncharacterized protein MELLADRAFT_110144 [Melampsora larici-populina 98AG31]|uniref:Uncharacterized protein n=1 Tax=Melampsora larici-populina (strain 98AG31 / pathotype 3-4-7) TaxID=747676 RepID=F4RYT9_MELLP|nr:uncharacterized protein MELLADRAFT_110144 [Melampsora larici-populina 98AG31]EGG02307.1 hypothetical protein MELLADRAFT_110144 [Melampsora larici-populina 98AG31]